MAEKTKAPRNRIAHKDWLIEARRAELAKWLDSDNRKHRMGEEAGKTLIREKMLKYRLSHDFDDDYDQYFGLGEYKGKANPYAETSEVRSSIRNGIISGNKREYSENDDVSDGESTAITDTEWETTAEVRGPYTTGDKAGTFSDTDASISTEELDERAADYEKKRKTEKPHSRREHKKSLTEWATKEKEEKGHNDEWFEATVGDENVDRQYRNYLRSEGFNKEADKQDKRFNRKSERQLKEDKLAETKETRRVAKEQQDSAITSNQRRQSKHQKQARKNIATEAIDFGALNKGSFGMKKEGFSVDTPKLDKYDFNDAYSGGEENKFQLMSKDGSVLPTGGGEDAGGMDMAGMGNAVGAVSGAFASMTKLATTLTSGLDKDETNPFTNLAMKTQRRINKMKSSAGKIKDLEMADLTLAEQGAYTRGRSQGRGISTMNAINMGTYARGLGARRKVSGDFYNRMLGIDKMGATMGFRADTLTAGGEERRADRLDRNRDNYFSNVSQDLSDIGTYGQQTGKMMNTTMENKIAYQALGKMGMHSDDLYDYTGMNLYPKRRY